MSPINRNKQVRLDDELYARVERLMVTSGLTASDIIRLAMIAGIPRLESGEINPFSSGKIAEEPPVYVVQEAPASIRKKQAISVPVTNASGHPKSRTKKIKKN